MLTWAMVYIFQRSYEFPAILFIFSMGGDVAMAGFVVNAACGGCMR